MISDLVSADMIEFILIFGFYWKAMKRQLAEEEGFEPSVQFPIRHISNVLVSATHPLLRGDSGLGSFA